MGAVLLLLLSSHEACEDLDVCLGLALWGVVPASPRAVGAEPPCSRYLVISRGVQGPCRAPEPPWFPPYLHLHGAQLALSFPAIPGGCVENEWKRQLAVLACLLTSPRKNVSDFSLTPWAGREEGLLKLQSLPCLGRSAPVCPPCLGWHLLPPLLCRLMLSLRALLQVLSGPEAAGDPFLRGSFPPGNRGVCSLCCQPEEGAGSACRRHLGFQAILSQTLNVKGSEMYVPPATGGAWPGPPLPS